MTNEDLKAKYDEMHSQGVTSWFSDGREERDLILKMGEPWKGLRVLEIGCGEGDLIEMIGEASGAWAVGVDYSEEAWRRRFDKDCRHSSMICEDFHRITPVTPADRLVMQGLLEHLDDPFKELQWMIDHFKPKTVITSSPCFLNPRGIVWMTLAMVGAVMSKTDLHFLHPWQFEEFCQKRGYRLRMEDCDDDWGNGKAMILDYKKRLPLALKDGNLEGNVDTLLSYLKHFTWTGLGATMVYRIDL